MKSNAVIDKVMESNKIKNIGLRKEAIIDILSIYNDIAFKTLLENGNIDLGNGLLIEVVQLLDRVHVLRGNTYKSNRKYKLKLTMEDEVYKRIEEYYEKLREEIQ